MRVAKLAAILVATLGAIIALRMVPFQLDDAFITYRFADRFAAHGEIAFNSSGAWVEGFTSPLWFLLLAAVSALFGPETLPATTVALGLLAYFLVLALIFRLGRRAAHGSETVPALVPLALVALSPSFLFYAVSGMEELLLVAALLLFLAAATGALALGPGLAAAALAVWVRPEAVAIPVVAAIALAAGGDASALRGGRFRSLCGALLAGTALLLSIRWLCFNQLLPNTYFAKTASSSAGVRYLLESLSSPALGGLVAVGLAGALAGGRRHRGFALAALAWFAIAVVEGGDWMPHARFLLPGAALAALAAQGLFSGRGESAGGEPRGARRLARSLAPVALAVVLAIAVLVSLMTAWRVDRTEARWRAELAALLDFLGEREVRSIGLVDIGRVGFSTDLDIFDFGGLVDPVIARSPGPLLGKRFDLSYLFEERRPDVLLFRFRRPPGRGPDGPTFRIEDAGSPVEARILVDARLRRDYRMELLLLPGWTPDRYQDRYSCRLLFVARSLPQDRRATEPPSPLASEPLRTITIADPLADRPPAEP